MSSLTLWQPKSTDSRPLAVEWVERLLQKFAARYGTLFSDRYAGVPQDVLASEWAEELAGYSKAELLRGLEGCRALKFPPTLPEFAALCRPPIDAHVAFVEAVRNLAERDRGDNPEWSHPAIFWASTKIGSHDMRAAVYNVLRSRWERALGDELAKREWPPIPTAQLALPAASEVRGPTPEEAAKLRDLVAHMKASKTTKATT